MQPSSLFFESIKYNRELVQTITGELVRLYSSLNKEERERIRARLYAERINEEKKE